MPITIPGNLRCSTTPRPLPGALAVALAAPGAVAVKFGSSVDGGSVPLEPIDNTTKRPRYYGYAWKAAGANEQPPFANGAIVEGFAGVAEGLVWIGDDGTLVQVAPAGLANEHAIGIGIRSTAIYFFVR